MSSLPKPIAEVKPKPYIYKCSLKSCQLEEPDASLVLCWRKEWAEWGVVRSFRVVCLGSSFDEGYSCFRSDLYHYIPLRGETGECENWLDDLGFLDDPDGFICDLVDSKLFVSGTAITQLAKLAYPNDQKRQDTFWSWWWDEQLSRKKLEFKDDSYRKGLPPWPGLPRRR